MKNRTQGSNRRYADSVSEDRREFIRQGLIVTSLVVVSPAALLAGGSPSGACDLTYRDFYGLGPYYSQGAPFREILAPANEPGERLFITGVVYANDCVTPLSGVVVDVWQADDNGCYNRFQTCDIPTQGDDYKLRGRMTTTDAGVFAFESVKPGRYLNGSQYRPSHIHFKFIHPEIPELVTQLYFEGDPYIPVDAAASRADAASRIIPLVEAQSGLHGVFDVILNVTPQTSGIDNPYNNAGYDLLRQNYPNPVASSTTIPFVLAANSTIELTIHDELGRTVRTLTHGRRTAGVQSVEWDGTDNRGRRLPAGIYLCKLSVGGTIQARKIIVE